MPNWIEGTLKLRGKVESIKKFIENEINDGPDCTKLLVVNEPEYHYVEYHFYNEPHVKGTKRAFITNCRAYMDTDEKSIEEEIIICLSIEQAWGFTDPEVWLEKSHQYNIDIRLFGIESGMQFTQEVIILRDRDVVVNNITKFVDFEWECPFPEMGG